MNDVERAWLACAIDGEGSIEIRRAKDRRSPVRISISNTNLAFLKKAKELAGCGNCYSIKRERANWKQCYQFSINRHEDVLRILKEIIGYLIIKKQLANEAIIFINNYHWRFNITGAEQQLIDFIVAEAKTKGIRRIVDSVNKNFNLNITGPTIHTLIKKRAEFKRNCKVCGTEFEVSRKHQRYCAIHTKGHN